MTVVRKTVAHAKAAEGYDFVLSDATIDRYGDIILSDGWQLDNFRRNPIALFAHNSSFVIGKWRNIKVDGGALKGTLDLAPEGTSDRIDEIRKLVDANILCAVSVGFSPITYKARDNGEGYVYEQQELVECSVVSIPANPSALQVAKALGISDATQRLIFGKTRAERQSTKTTRTKEERLAILARAREILARPQKTPRFITRKEARAISDAARALLNRGGVRPIYDEHEMRRIHERALAILSRGNKGK